MDLLSAIRATGFSVAEFERRTNGISYDTIKRISLNPSSVKPETLDKAKAALASLIADRESALKSAKSA
jgi:hypothetical protein